MADTDTTTNVPFEEDIFVVLGAQNCTDDEKAVLLARMVEIVQTRVMEKIFNRLSETEKDEFLRLLESASSDDMNDYLGQHVPGFEQMYEDEGKMLRQELILKLAA